MLSDTAFRVSVRMLAILGVLSIFVHLFFLASYCAAVNIEPGDPGGFDPVRYARSVASEPRTPQWFPEGDRIAFSHAGGVYVIDSTGTHLELIDGGGDELDLAFAPSVSPDGSRIAYTAYERHGWIPWNRSESWEIVTAKPDGSDRRLLTENDTLDLSPVWSPDGSRIAFVGPKLWQITVIKANDSGSHSAVNASEVVWSKVSGRPAWSPDGSRLAFTTESHSEDVMYVVGVDGSNLTRLGDGPRDGIGVPAWSPDGRRIAFAKLDGIYTITSDGSELRYIASLPSDLDSRPDSISWSPDGSTILWRGYVIKVDGSTEESRLGSRAAWSPNGSRIAVYSTYHYNIALFTTGPDGLGGRVLVEETADGLVPANGRPLP